MAVLLRPVITEKSITQAAFNQYTFEVDRRANAIQIAQAVSDHYGVTVIDVRVINVGGVVRRNRRGLGFTRDWKKALITLKKGDKIPGFEIETEQPDEKGKKSVEPQPASK